MTLPSEPFKCPECGSTNCSRDEVDVGVGIMYGPWGCSSCGWSEYEPNPEDGLNPEKFDPQGGYWP
jgi:transcription elongation factor Elf1